MPQPNTTRTSSRKRSRPASDDQPQSENKRAAPRTHRIEHGAPAGTSTAAAPRTSKRTTSRAQGSNTAKDTAPVQKMKKQQRTKQQPNNAGGGDAQGQKNDKGKQQRQKKDVRQQNNKGKNKEQEDDNGGAGESSQGGSDVDAAPKRLRNGMLETPYSKYVLQAQRQLTTIARELSLLEAYEGDGWQGVHKEKFKPKAEMMRARASIRRCKDAIRECLRACEEVQGETPIPPESFDEEGEDNDIVMCDGACNRAYHEHCSKPPFVAANIPEDCLWFCSACDAKADIIDNINDVMETEYAVEHSWKNILSPEDDLAFETAMAMVNGDDAPNGTNNDAPGWLAHELPSEDEGDSDFDVSSDEEEEEEDAVGGEGVGGEEEAKGKKKGKRVGAKVKEEKNLVKQEGNVVKEEQRGNDMVGRGIDKGKQPATEYDDDEKKGKEGVKVKMEVDEEDTEDTGHDEDEEEEDEDTESSDAEDEEEETSEDLRADVAGLVEEELGEEAAGPSDRRQRVGRGGGNGGAMHTITDADRRRAVAAAQAEEDADPSTLIITGKRRRPRVDYAQMAAEMLVDGLLAEDGEDQEDWAPTPR